MSVPLKPPTAETNSLISHLKGWHELMTTQDCSLSSSLLSYCFKHERNAEFKAFVSLLAEWDTYDNTQAFETTWLNCINTEIDICTTNFYPKGADTLFRETEGVSAMFFTNYFKPAIATDPELHLVINELLESLEKINKKYKAEITPKIERDLVAAISEFFRKLFSSSISINVLQPIVQAARKIDDSFLLHSQNSAFQFAVSAIVFLHAICPVIMNPREFFNVDLDCSSRLVVLTTKIILSFVNNSPLSRSVAFASDLTEKYFPTYQTWLTKLYDSATNKTAPKLKPLTSGVKLRHWKTIYRMISKQQNEVLSHWKLSEASDRFPTYAASFVETKQQISTHVKRRNSVSTVPQANTGLKSKSTPTIKLHGASEINIKKVKRRRTASAKYCVVSQPIKPTKRTKSKSITMTTTTETADVGPKFRSFTG